MNESQAEKAYAILKKKIIDQELWQGATVVEKEIADELGMSRTPVREAIRRLDADGLLEIMPRKGTYIKVFTIHNIIDLYEV
ncbi:MAG: GntR family transcriptional regulator, partial [Sphaerochaetaceae bacterium]|nr:GntR family transcriptional regulator [Sphaerochaetaceae bacterium]